MIHRALLKHTASIKKNFEKKLNAFLPLLFACLISQPLSADHLLIHHALMQSDNSAISLRSERFKKALVESVARKLNVSLVNDDCPFKRCMAQLHDGNADLIVLITVTEERKEYLDYFHMIESQGSSIPFYIRSEDTNKLMNYQDLYRLNVGVVKGVAYFERFDSDALINKMEMQIEAQLPKLLLSKRIDAFIAHTLNRDDMMKEYPEITIAKFKQPYPPAALVAISKSSSNYEFLKQHLPGAFNELVAEGSLKALCQQHGSCPPEIENYTVSD